VEFFVFLVLEEGSTALTHHLPAGCEDGCVFRSTPGSGCKLVEAKTTSRTEDDFNGDSTCF
jgi:hypothetical protein